MATKRSEPRSPSERPALALAAATFGLFAPLAYLGQRLYERARAQPLDPTLILRESHTAFYWRAGTAAWWAGIAAIVVFAWASRRAPGERGVRALYWATLPFAAAVVWIAWRHP